MQVYLHNAGYECDVVEEPVSTFVLIWCICSSPKMHQFHIRASNGSPWWMALLLEIQWNGNWVPQILELRESPVYQLQCSLNSGGYAGLVCTREGDHVIGPGIILQFLWRRRWYEQSLHCPCKMWCRKGLHVKWPWTPPKSLEIFHSIIGIKWWTGIDKGI